jgi:cytoskeletal protein RodZ
LEQLQEIGAQLAKLRQEQAKSLEEIAARTYIPLRLLKAIETGQEQSLPEPVFVQGFIRRYADVLGLNGLELSKNFPVQTMVIPKPEPQHGVEGFEAAPAFATESWTPRPEHDRPHRRIPVGVFVGVGALALAGVLFAVIKPTLNQGATSSATAPRQEASTAGATSPAASSPAPATEPTPTVASPTPTVASPTPAVVTSPSPATSQDSVNVSVTVTGEEAWIAVSVDGKNEFEGLLQKGDTRSWSGKQAVTIFSGNAGAVSVALNGESAEPLGDPGQLDEKTFTPDGVE